MLPVQSPPKKIKSTSIDSVVSPKNSITCTNVPEDLFDSNAAKKHFNKFGRVQRIRFFPKRQMCIVEYDQPTSAGKAILNAGAFDGFMFDVTRTKQRMRKKSAKEEDPDWLPDSDVEEELSAMAGTPTYRTLRPVAMDVTPAVVPPKAKSFTRVVKQSPVRKKAVSARSLPIPSSTTIGSGRDSPIIVSVTQTSMTTIEAAAELNQLRSKVAQTPDEQWRLLDARDKILRAWGGAGSRVKVGGATIGLCPDMCPEKERLHRQAEHQVMSLETDGVSDSALVAWRAVKQYSRSSADQEMPMGYELRPANVLSRTCAYLLHEVADTTRPVTAADWFHFMWDRLRGIRKDITQQALCCAESIRLVEMCARFHAHCAARLADLEHTQFDQRLNTDNLTKCLQTLKHMYGDVKPEQKPNEPEFRGYIALLNLGDANFWWEIKQLPEAIQKSSHIIFALQIFNALDNNNYVRFFRLVKEKATYLQSCILLRYFNDVRARALARIVKAYAPRGGSRYPAQDLYNALAFESIEHMKSFINHYGLRFAKTDEDDPNIILDRHQFIEDSDPYPISRAFKLIESKCNSSVARVIAGGQLPTADYKNHSLYCSFNADGKLKESALIAEDYGYNTVNDSDKDIKALKAEIQRLVYGKSTGVDKQEPQKSVFAKPNLVIPPSSIEPDEQITFYFNPATPVEPIEEIQNLFEKPLNTFTFSFAKPELLSVPSKQGVTFNKPVLSTAPAPNLFATKPELQNKKVFGLQETKAANTNNIFSSSNTKMGVFNNQESTKSLFEASKVENVQANNLFANLQNKNIFANRDSDANASQNVFAKNLFSGSKEGSLFSKVDNAGKDGGSIFGKTMVKQDDVTTKTSKNIFGSFSNMQGMDTPDASTGTGNQGRSIFAVNGRDTKLSPSSLFKSAVNQPDAANSTNYTIFQGKNNRAQTVADNILKSVNTAHTSIYDFRENQEDEVNQYDQLQQLQDESKKLEENRIREKLMREEMIKQEELRRIEEQKRREEELLQEEIRLQEERRLAEEKRKQEELRMRLEEERLAEIKRKEEEERIFRAAVDKESSDLVEELICEIEMETVVTILKEEVDKFKDLMKFAGQLTEHVVNKLCIEMCIDQLKAEKFRIDKLRRKWFKIWKEKCARNYKRRNYLQDTPVWLPNKTPVEEAKSLRRKVENVALSTMNAFNQGYIFNGEFKPIPPPERYNIVEIIRSPLLKRLKEIQYPYDKCVFWKVTLVSPGETKWLQKKINIHKWLIDAFSDKKNHEVSTSLVQLGKESWNNLIDFAISISLINPDKIGGCGEAVEGTNGYIFYFTEKDKLLFKLIKEVLKHRYKHQVIPLVIIMPKLDDTINSSIETFLKNAVKNNYIKAYKIFIIDNKNVPDSINACTKSAMKWIAKNYPPIPPLEIDNLKSICERYLGNEIWCNFKSERDPRMKVVTKHLNKLILCYNVAVDKLKEVITNRDLFNYAPFPLEFKQFLNSKSPYPKPYEFIPSNVRSVENISAIEFALNSLKLPSPRFSFAPIDICNMQKQIRAYSCQIGWFKNPDQVVCKVITKLPNELTDLNTSREDFKRNFQNFDLIDFLKVLVSEKINNLQYFKNIFAVYKKPSLGQYCTADWLYDTNLLCNIKHKPLNYDDDDVDYYIASKRRKIERDSMEILMLKDKDVTLVEENIKTADLSLAKYSVCTDAIKELEMKLEEGNKKSVEFENFLKSALCNV